MDSLFFVVAVVVILAPIASRIRVKITTPPQLEPCDLTEIPPQHKSYFFETQQMLEAEGFTCSGYYARILDKRITQYLALLTHQNHRDRATINHASHTRWVEFCADFMQRESIETVNAPYEGVGQDVTKKRSFVFPQIRDIHELYHLHTILIARYIGEAVPVFLEEETVLEGLKHSMITDLNLLVHAGHFYKDHLSETYRPTWKGAIWMTLRSLFPIHRLLTTRKATRLHKELTMSKDTRH